MNETFSQLFEKSLKNIQTKTGSIISGTVIAIKKDSVLIDSGLKSESYVPIEQFRNKFGHLEVKVGDNIDVALDAIEDGFGETILSREKAKKHECWIELEKAYAKSEIVMGIIIGRVKGGFTVELNDLRAFLPGSLVDIRPIKDTSHLENKELEFKVIKLDQKRNNVVVSRKAVIESETSAERDQLLLNLQEGMKIKGIIKNLTDYGAFVDLGGVDGLLHITDMSWKRVKHPSDIVSIGDEIFVKILKFDKEKTRVSLGLKQLSEDPWNSILTRYHEGKKITGRVTNLTDYGCFVEIEEGIEGLVHISEIDWTNKNIHPNKIVHINEIVKVMILDIDAERRRISLGIKQCKPNPWEIFSKVNKRGVHVKGKIKSITDFGIFIGLKGGIDGLVHLSDLSWKHDNEKELNKYKKGNDIIAVVLQVDPERERISLGIKQLKEDTFSKYIQKYKKDDIVPGQVISINNKIAKIDLGNDVIGIINITKKLDVLNINDLIECKFNKFDRKNRIIKLILYKIYKNKKDEKQAFINKFKNDPFFKLNKK
ncbi:30S ribosomal protein S1 [Buchnera aphidicola]|uniref:30S ribosomal protein S1 n=1 Tax=Buchnera aphidicola (Therioaphis trifolii) TaxID=1241884 RepID=A0A4D6YMY5_9GAMM|nr:30S ribosomal protein S1 [Buchnera aphidicola]QCI27208.1 30S ribosomal protein S1 [Buchnera aphidicola (Therioaphis trifolii)]